MAAIYSEESERTVLASVLLSPDVLPLISGRLRADDFYLERHQTLYQVMLDLLAVEKLIDVRTLQATLEQRGLFDGLGGIPFLDSICSDRSDLTRVDTHVELVKERATRRKLIAICRGITEITEPSESGDGE